MKYLKLFNESTFSPKNNKDEYISDILRELEDTGKVRVSFQEPSRKGQFVSIRTSSPDRAIYWDDLSDSVLRIKDYLGDSLSQIRIRKHPIYTKNKNTDPDWIDIDPDENTKIYFGLWSLIIKYT